MFMRTASNDDRKQILAIEKALCVQRSRDSTKTKDTWCTGTYIVLFSLHT